MYYGIGFTHSDVYNMPSFLRKFYYKKLFETKKKESDEIKEGFVAHEVQEVIPSAVNREKDIENGLQTINLDAIVSVLTKALQEAVAKIETLETKVAALEGS